MTRNRSRYRRSAWLAALLSALALCTACTVQLAPPYDASLVNGIRGVSNDIMQLYASAGMGVSKTTFVERAGQYNAIIGRADALALQSQSRPVADSALRDKADQAIKQRLAISPLPKTVSDDALALAAGECADARHVPRTPALPSFGPPPANTQPQLPASALALAQVSRAIALLRDTDCAHGLNGAQVAANKGYVTHFMSEALVYETFLQQ
ncbi:hypothetical protein [Caballeronia humi]|jgi:hypothetical protein|uniref:Lipoprotein n=1 Tax=Caballeronia humi TaxID=326474 RepID=A0A158IX21_9BURK|nr:hypothetical protein [Caballeronia humi]SAL61137.1 hypothetical protein AWB65_05557 [Caballeronia humi]